MTQMATKTYEYEAVDARGNKTKGKLDAATEEAVANSLRQQGVVPLKINRTGTGLQRDVKIPGLGGKTTTKDVAIFARQFATMSASGLSLLRSLAILEDQAIKPSLQKTIREVRQDVESGSSLSAAMGKHDRIFPRLMVSMVNAGETGGFLDSALDRIANTLEKDANLKAKVKSALTYPVIVIVFSLVMIGAVLAFIVPVFEKMFAQLGGQLPLPTQILVTLSHQMVWIAPITIAITVGVTLFVKNKLRTDYTWRLAVDRFKLRMPVFGKLFTKIALSRFARNLGTLLSVGVPVMQSLDVVGGTTGNAVIAEAMKDIANAVRDGQPMSSPLRKHPIFPPMVTQMMEVGEETGQISAMLDKIADFYDHEVETATESLTAAIEPIMVVVMGGLVGGMVVCLYLPMFTIYQNIQGAS